MRTHLAHRSAVMAVDWVDSDSGRKHLLSVRLTVRGHMCVLLFFNLYIPKICLCGC